MPWQCRLVGTASDYGALPVSALVPGTMYYGEPCMIDRSNRYGAFCLMTLLSSEYLRDWLATRLPLFVVLPNGEEFCPDFSYSYTRGNTQEGWTVTGDAPNITVSPSINFVGRWHGFLQNGVLSEDVEGRTFPR